jgi:hypothetical protein
MRKALVTLALAGLVATLLAVFSAGSLKAGALTGLGGAFEHEPILTPVLVWKDCQRIALCTGCAPVYRCRSCNYQRTCDGGVCGWGDVCVWGPYVKVLPRGARIIRQ